MFLLHRSNLLILYVGFRWEGDGGLLEVMHIRIYLVDFYEFGHSVNYCVGK